MLFVSYPEGVNSNCIYPKRKSIGLPQAYHRPAYLAYHAQLKRHKVPKLSFTIILRQAQQNNMKTGLYIIAQLPLQYNSILYVHTQRQAAPRGAWFTTALLQYIQRATCGAGQREPSIEKRTTLNQTKPGSKQGMTLTHLIAHHCQSKDETCSVEQDMSDWLLIFLKHMLLSVLT